MIAMSTIQEVNPAQAYLRECFRPHLARESSATTWLNGTTQGLDCKGR